MNKDSLGDRMKRYENVTRNYLVRRTPVIVRLDGKAFHTLTAKHCVKPFDDHFHHAMEKTSIRLLEEVQGCTFVYTQSDEISLLLFDYQKLDTQAWFDNNIQKMVSVSASIASVTFSTVFGEQGFFDARAFNLPEAEVCNYFVWRQNDAIRNSIQAVGQAHFSQKELHKLNVDQIKAKLLSEHGVNWDLHIKTKFKRGLAVSRVPNIVDSGVTANFAHWIALGYPNYKPVVDEEIPIFSQNREFVERHLPKTI